MIRRFLRYFGEMLPLQLHLPMGMVLFLTPYYLGEALYGPCRFPWDVRLVCGALAYALAMVLLRVMDDIKDYDTDKVNFAARFTAQEGISKGELQGAMGVLLAVVIGLGLSLGPTARSAFGVVIIYALLMFKYFFYPPIARSLVLAVVTHNPIIPLSQLYALSFLIDRHGWSALTPAWLAIIFALWMPLLAWEVGRKIRAPQEETAYQTYSKLLGHRGAALLVLGVLGLGAAAMGWLIARLALTPIFAVVYAGALVYVAARAIAFIRHPRSRPIGLRPEVELVVAVTALGSLAALGARCWGG